MRLYLAALSDKPFLNNISSCKYMLESFYYVKDWQLKYIKDNKNFLLDSGAFTFMNCCKNKNICWEEYVDKYADFINKNNIVLFFELDIDKLIGYDNVLKLRKRLETKTGKQCIPVWHKSRGKDEYFKLCKDYNYIAIGGIAIKDIKKEEYQIFTYLINEAHKQNTKVHGLGFTSLKGLTQYSFDSVDSTSWKSGGRFGQLHIFNNNTIKSVSYKNKRAKEHKIIDQNNFTEWVKFQQYAERWL